MRRPRPLTLLAMGAMIAAFSLLYTGLALGAPGPGAWQKTGPLLVGVENPTLTTLPSGEALVAGGSRAGGSSAAETHGTTDMAEIYEPSRGVWSATGSMLTPRVLHTATLLEGGVDAGEVLVTGGENVSGASVASAELYDPITGAWSTTAGAMTTDRAGQMATLLKSGEVLIVGGNFAAGPAAELYDPSTGIFEATAPMPVDPAFGTATLLESGIDAGDVLVTGGFVVSGGETVRTTAAELYDPNTNTWSQTGSMLAPRDLQTATLLPSGEVLIAGGYNLESGSLSSAELYDPATGSFSATGSMMLGRWEPSATSLPSGEVLVAGGSLEAPSAELYDPASGTWRPTSPMGRTRLEHKATLLSSGNVLVVGGDFGDPENSISSAEVFDPQPSADPQSVTARHRAHGRSARRHVRRRRR